MKESLLDLSGKIDRFTVGLLNTIADVAESLNIQFFVIGAKARDIILSEGYGIQTGRATQDIDLGAFALLTTNLAFYEGSSTKFNLTNRAKSAYRNLQALVGVLQDFSATATTSYLSAKSIANGKLVFRTTLGTDQEVAEIVTEGSGSGCMNIPLAGNISLKSGKNLKCATNSELRIPTSLGGGSPTLSFDPDTDELVIVYGGTTFRYLPT